MTSPTPEHQPLGIADVTDALARTAAPYGPPARPLTSNPPADEAAEIVNAHTEASADATPPPRYQPQVGIQDPDTGEQMDPAAPSASAEGKTGYKPEDSPAAE